jgi:hypothetical protein
MACSRVNFTFPFTTTYPFISPEWHDNTVTWDRKFVKSVHKHTASHLMKEIEAIKINLSKPAIHPHNE